MKASLDKLKHVPLFFLAMHLFASEARFTDELWAGIEPVYAKTLQHPFLTGLADGTLPRAKFEFYLQQDALFLETFSDALKTLATKAPRNEWQTILNQHAADAITEEQQLHLTLLRGKTAREKAPSNYAYTNHLLATVTRRPFAEGLAAVLPCYWIYWEVGKELKKRGSRDADYQRWIDVYSDEGYRESVMQVLRMMNSTAEGLDAAARERLKELFTRSARYEYMFWDMAWKEERWPPPLQ
jgi:thiaminase/transcriptional activator TenA